MNQITIAWIVLPFLAGFSGYLLPWLGGYLAGLVALASFVYGLHRLFDPQILSLQLLDSFSVTLLVDSHSALFILTNAMVTAAVVLYCIHTEKTAFFYTQISILHGSINAALISADFISLYVALEVISIAAFLLITYSRTDRSIWVGLRYLFVSNTAMLFYLIGAVLVYQANQSFAYSGLQQAPTEAIVLILIGLLTKGGIFISGLWLPLTHSESETPVSALLSGIVIKAGVFPLIRCALMVESFASILVPFSLATVMLGGGYALFERDTKRTLALSTISQVGFVLVAPAVAGFYALSHGLAKAALFLVAGNLPSRSFDQLQQMPIRKTLWVALVIASLSISGFPLVAGFGAKILTFKSIDPWQSMVLNGAAIVTAVIFAKFIFLPIDTPPRPALRSTPSVPQATGLALALTLLIGGLFLTSGLHPEVYTLPNLGKALAILVAGWLAYFLVFRRQNLNLPRSLEKFDNLIGMMSLMLTLLFWMVLI